VVDESFSGGIESHGAGIKKRVSVRGADLPAVKTTGARSRLLTSALHIIAPGPMKDSVI
jgi:hypothetical protein